MKLHNELNQYKLRYYNGCGVSMSPQSVYAYPQGHPCYGCPYTFPTDKLPARLWSSCTMGGTPGDCPWYFYKKMMSRRTTIENEK